MATSSSGTREFEVLYTLEARNSIALEVMSDYFDLQPSTVFQLIRGMHLDVKRRLASQGVNYRDLKWALAPAKDREEHGFLFDWARLGDNTWYPAPIYAKMIPLLNRQSSRSLMVGDWLSRYSLAPDEVLKRSDLALRRGGGAAPTRDVPNSLYVVYLNNLSATAAAQLDAAFSTLEGYLGDANLTYASPFKSLVATMLAAEAIQHRGKIITTCADDDEAENPLPYFDYASAGFQVVTIPQSTFGIFLNYKIERHILASDSRDRDFALNALTPSPMPFQDCKLILDESRLEHLKSQKSGSLRRSGLEGLDRDNVLVMLKAKLTANYIYNMRWSEEGDLMFNVIVEPRRGVKSVLGLKYMPERQEIHVVTYF